MKKLSKIDESVWNDIRKQSAGTKTRKETLIDDFTFDELFKYLKENYMTNSDSYIKQDKTNKGDRYIDTAIFKQGQNYLDLFYNEQSSEIIFRITRHDGKFESLVETRIKVFLDLLKVEFTMRQAYKDEYCEGYAIKPHKDRPKTKSRLYVRVLNMSIIAFGSKTKKESYMLVEPVDKSILEESTWNDIRKQSSGSQVRKEDGERVKTCLGNYCIIKNPNAKYDEAIKYLIDKYPSSDYCTLSIMKASDAGKSRDEMINISKGVAPYDYYIYEGLYGTSLLVCFFSYDELEEFGDDLVSCFDMEDDYISVCKCVANKLKEVGENIEYVPRSAYMLSESSFTASKYQGEYAFLLLDENSYYNWILDDEERNYREFIDAIKHKFKELEDEDFIGWSYRDGINIAIPINHYNLVNLKKYLEYTEKWIKNEETE